MAPLFSTGEFWLFYRLIASVRHQRHKSGELNGIGNDALMLVAQLVAGRGFYLELGGDVLAQELRVFVVNSVDVVLAKIALHSFRMVGLRL